jgi:hypothetical protein
LNGLIVSARVVVVGRRVVGVARGVVLRRGATSFRARALADGDAIEMEASPRSLSRWTGIPPALAGVCRAPRVAARRRGVACVRTPMCIQ